MSILAQKNSNTWIIAASLVALAALLYFLTAARDIVVGDSPELITAAVTLGVPHPPGYPLFTMLGHLFSLWPFGPIPFRVNLLSVVCNSLTIGIVFLTALRLCGSRIAAALAALLLAVNPTFWAWSLASEVFPLNNLLVSLLIYFLISWHQQPEQQRLLIAAFFLSGLALTNHQTSVLVAPAFSFVLWQRRAALVGKYKIFAACLAAFVIGLLPYIYIPWAAAHHPPYNWGNVSSLHDFAALIARRSYGSGSLVGTAGYSGGSSLARIVALCISFGLIAGTLSIFGAIETYWRQKWYFWFGLIAFAGVGPFFIAITNLNLNTAPSALFVLQRFFLLPQVVIAPFLAFGILMIARVASLRLVGAVIALAVLINIGTNYRRIDQSHNHIARSFGEDVFATVEPGTIILSTGDGIVLPLIYLQTVEGIGRDVSVVALPLMAAAWYVDQLRERSPALNVPFDHYDGQTNNLKMLVEANNGRTFAIAGGIGESDRSLDGNYWPHQHGLVSIIESKEKKFTIDEMVNDNERLSSRYRPPSIRDVRVRSFEQDILSAYAWPAFRIGNDYERIGRKTDARNWFQRALSIDPNLAPAREGLARTEP